MCPNWIRSNRLNFVKIRFQKEKNAYDVNKLVSNLENYRSLEGIKVSENK
jgi:hypothetical protein